VAYAAINSAVDELIPARIRGHVDLAINSTFWLGAAMGSGITALLLNPAYFSPSMGWRFAFGVGAMLGTGILFLRSAVPESPRWLMIHGQRDEADRVVAEIESKVLHGNTPQDSDAAPHGDTAPHSEPVAQGTAPAAQHRLTTIHPRSHTPWREIVHTILVEHRTRSLLGLTLMIAQAFFYNAAGFFSIPLILEKFYEVPADQVSLHLIWFALGNALGPIILGPLFDSIGRRPMIIFTYATSGVLLAIVQPYHNTGHDH
jgi:MFS family permease